MKKKIFAFVLAFMFILPCALLLTACGKKDPYVPPRNVVQRLPEKIHVEYGSTIFVKDGNEYYLSGENIHRTTVDEVYMKDGLTHEVFVTDRWGGMLYITAYYDDNTDDNHNTYTNSEELTRQGYSEVNSPLDSYTITKLADQTVAVGTNEVECEVWLAVWEYNNSYAKYKLWYAKGTGVFIKGLKTSDKTVDIDTEGYVYGTSATYYAVGENMADVLATKDRVAPDMSAFT